MAHWAKIENNIVEQVLIVDNTITDGQDYLASQLGLGGTWIQTSYNTRGGIHYSPVTNQPDGGIALNMNYAGIGYSWDGIGFAAPQPFSSWTLNKETYEWNPPVAYPTDKKPYFWDEESKTWAELSNPSTPQAGA
jgi:hypothetical protein